MTGHQDEYTALDGAGEELTNIERRVGWFEAVDA